MKEKTNKIKESIDENFGEIVMVVCGGACALIGTAIGFKIGFNSGAISGLQFALLKMSEVAPEVDVQGLIDKISESMHAKSK